LLVMKRYCPRELTKGTADAESCESECRELHFAGEIIDFENMCIKNVLVWKVPERLAFL
jgi:hypothetical protein